MHVEEVNDPTEDDTLKRAYDLAYIKISDAGARVQSNALSPVTNTSDIHSIADLYAYVNGKGDISQGYRLRKIGIAEEVKCEIKTPRTDFTLTCHTAA